MILDMGLARLDEPAAAGVGPENLTTTGQAMGTFPYMAPEQALDTHQADARSDIYSLGCTLFRLLTGKSPYPRPTIVRAILAHREDPIPVAAPRRGLAGNPGRGVSEDGGKEGRGPLPVDGRADRGVGGN